MTKKELVHEGVIFGLWQVEESPPGRYVTCLCKCGKRKKVDYLRLLNGDSKSCGCAKMKHMEETNLKKYGVRCSLENEEIKVKAKITNLQKYGCVYAASSDIVQAKMRKTNQRKYKVDYPMQNRSIAQKAIESLIRVDGIPTSKAQVSLYELLQTQYKSAQLNVLVGDRMCVDIVLQVQEIKIAIEYDGGGHFAWSPRAEVLMKDRRRDEILKQCGFKVLRVESPSDKVPTLEQLEESIGKLLTTSYSFIRIRMKN